MHSEQVNKEREKEWSTCITFEDGGVIRDPHWYVPDM